MGIPVIPNGDMETSSSWVFDGTGGYTLGGKFVNKIDMFPQSGSQCAWLEAWATDGDAATFLTDVSHAYSSVVPATMWTYVMVNAGDEGYYSLDGFAFAGPDGFLDGLMDTELRVYFDGVFWGAVGDIVQALYGTSGHWMPFNYGGGWAPSAQHSIYWSVGQHKIQLVPSTNHRDIFGVPFPDNWRVVVYIDSLRLTPEPTGTVLAGTFGPLNKPIRLIHSGTGKVRLVRHNTGKIRLVHHG